MRYVVTAEEMRRYDANTIEQIGIPGMVLMERAALAVRDTVLTACDAIRPTAKKPSVLIMAGVGNNGGDGLALARLLANSHFEVTVWCVGSENKASGQWKSQRKILESYDVCFCDIPTDKEYTILADALFGVGLSREVTGVYKEAIEHFNSLRGYKIALDVPSGICSDSGRVLGCAVHVDETVTFAFAKRGLYLHPGCEYVGKLTVADIGIDEHAFMGDSPKMFCMDRPTEWLPARNAFGNKGTFGKVLLIVGSRGMAGAAILCARAAYRSGAGMVKVITDESNREVVQTSVPEAMYGCFDNLEESLKWADVVAIGPGIGKSPEAKKCLEAVVADCDMPLLIDADGLNLLADDKALMDRLAAQHNRPIIVTPHVGELSRLTGLSVACLKEELWKYGQEFAGKLHVIVVAKDARTFVCAENKPIYMNIYGNSGMATAGSGDVLAGIIAGIMAQHVGWRKALSGAQNEEGVLDAAFRMACAGVRLHAAAGDAVAREKGEYACMAGDLAKEVQKWI